MVARVLLLLPLPHTAVSGVGGCGRVWVGRWCGWRVRSTVASLHGGVWNGVCALEGVWGNCDTR